MVALLNQVELCIRHEVPVLFLIRRNYVRSVGMDSGRSILSFRLGFVEMQRGVAQC